MSQTEIKSGLRNRHLTIEGEYWRPFLMWECSGHGIYWEEDCPGERKYGGIMWDFLMFMKEARNFTFTLVHETDYIWGECYGVNNCTGMVGMVNRKEVDFAIGPFVVTHSLTHSVAYSSAMAHSVAKFIIPMRSTTDIWSFLHPLSPKVWLCLLTSIPVFILVCGLLDRLSSGFSDWTTLAGFALRNILVETMEKIPAIRAHQRVAFLGWIWFTFIVTTVYAGNLVAMITLPHLIMPIRDAEDLLAQDELTLVAEEGLSEVTSFSILPPSSIYRRVYEKLEFLKYHDEEYWPSECFSNSTQFSGRHVALCGMVPIKEMLHKSFSTDKQCNWYTTENPFFEAPFVMLFQIGSPYLDDANELINLANQMGFFDDKIQKYTPHASRCLTKSAIRETNREKHERRVLRLNDIYGMLFILTVGLAGALLAFAAELVAHKMLLLSRKSFYDKKKNRQMRRGNKRRPLAMIEKWAEIELDEPPKLNPYNPNPTVPATKTVNKVERHGNKRRAPAMIEKRAEIELHEPPKVPS